MQKVEQLGKLPSLGPLPHIVFAAFTVAAFWLTIGQPETLRPEDLEGPGARHKHTVAFSPDVVAQAMALGPGRLLSAGKPDLALSKAAELVAARPYDVLANICAGNIQCQVGNKDEGFRLLKTSVALAPRSRYVRLNLAEQLSRAKRYDEAVTQLNLIVGAYPHWPKPHLDLAQIYTIMDRPLDAAAEMKLALDADPTDYRLRKERALALARGGQPGKALDEFVRADTDELNLLGMPVDLKQAEQNWGTLDRAVYEYRRALEQSPDDPLTKLRLARVLIYRGQTDEARTLLLEAKKKAPQNVEIHRNLALVMQKMGDSGPAVSEFKISVSLEQAHKRSEQEKQD